MKRVAFALPLALLAAGCGLGSQPESPTVPKAVVQGGVLRIGITGPTSVDPAQAYDRDGQLVVAAMCDPLLEVDPATGELYAGLSEHIVPEANGTGVTITLKDDLRFSDGSPAVVKDVRASLSRLAGDSLASPLAEEVRAIQGFQKVHGDVAVEDEDDPARTILEGTAQVTKKVVTVTLSSPDAEFAARLTRPWSAITPARTSERSDFAKRPVCVGPYRLAEDWHAGAKEITLVRSKAYFARNEAYTGGGRGYPDSLVFKVYSSAEAAFAGYLKGEVDVARVPRAKLGTPTPGGKTVTAPTPSLEYVGLPTNNGAFADPTVRLALSRALDRNALISALRRKDRTPATSLLPTVMPGGLGTRDRCSSTFSAKADVAGARALLAKQRVSLKGVALPLYVNDEPGSGNVEMMRAIGAQWAAAFGVVPKVIALPWTEYQTRGREGQGFDGPFRTSWTSPVPAAGAWLQPLFLSEAIGTTNLSRFTAPLLDKIYERTILKETDREVRQDFEAKILDELCVFVPIIPIWSATSSFVIRSNVGSGAGSFQRRFSGELDIRELYVRR